MLRGVGPLLGSPLTLQYCPSPLPLPQRTYDGSSQAELCSSSHFSSMSVVSSAWDQAPPSEPQELLTECPASACATSLPCELVPDFWCLSSPCERNPSLLSALKIFTLTALVSFTEMACL